TGPVRGKVVEMNGAGIKTAVFWKETFGEAIPAEARFIDDGRRDGGNVRQRNQLYSRGCCSVEPRNQPSADQCQWEALIAVADVIAASQKVVGIERVIDFYDGAVHTIRERRCQGDVVWLPIQAVVSVRGRGPRIACEKRSDNRVDHSAVVGRCGRDVC